MRNVSVEKFLSGKVIIKIISRAALSQQTSRTVIIVQGRSQLLEVNLLLRWTVLTFAPNLLYVVQRGLLLIAEQRQGSVSIFFCFPLFCLLL